MKRADYIISIDPDCEKSGVTLLQVKTKEINVQSMTFPLLLEFLKDSKELQNLHVVVEAGWLNHSHWHIGKYDSRKQAAAKGNSVGRNHETGRKIIEMAKHYGLHVEEVRPIKKMWRGPEGKITHDELAYFVKGLPSRTNQEVRDSVLLAWYYAGYPILSKPIKNVAKRVSL